MLVKKLSICKSPFQSLKTHLSSRQDPLANRTTQHNFMVAVVLHATLVQYFSVRQVYSSIRSTVVRF